MFGYVKVYKDELKVKEYDVFRSYYCGLCNTLKHEYGFASRLCLNYDSVFLALLLSSVTNTPISCKALRCIANPFKKRPVAVTSTSLSYSAAVMIIIAILKLEDDIRDEHSVKSFFSYIALLTAKHRVLKHYGSLFKECKKHILALSCLEKQNCTSVDKLAHEFGQMMQILFAPEFIKEDSMLRILEQIGYMLGRFIYITDAFEDMEKDKKKHCFNVFLLNDALPDKYSIRDSLTFTLSRIACDYELLDIKLNKPILDNIIYLGLPNVLDNLLNDKGEN